MRGPGIGAGVPGIQRDYAGAEGKQEFACGWVYIYTHMLLLLEAAPCLWQSGHDSDFCWCVHVMAGKQVEGRCLAHFSLNLHMGKQHLHPSAWAKTTGLQDPGLQDTFSRSCWRQPLLLTFFNNNKVRDNQGN